MYVDIYLFAECARVQVHWRSIASSVPSLSGQGAKCLAHFYRDNYKIIHKMATTSGYTNCFNNDEGGE